MDIHNRKTERIELLAPAKDVSVAVAAIDCGADAVYIGAPKFSARQAAGNTIEDIRRVVEYAHPYFAKVYVALNTLLFDEELPVAEQIIRQLYTAGIDGLIIQDMGILELDLPPIPLIASTQANNATPEKVKFLEEVGFSRAILARELTLAQIRDIRKQTSLQLECFVHGALCVGASGQCYMSYVLGGRSGNRGSCAQPCRRLYSLYDTAGNALAEGRYLLSIKDLNLSDWLGQLLDAGVTSFKIEGRLKDADYVANVVGFYRQKLDTILAAKGFARASSGTIKLAFQPDPARTFNRGYTAYGIDGKPARIGSIDTPKSRGQRIGKVASIDKHTFTLDCDSDLHNGDGLCFFDVTGTLAGAVVNGVEGRRIRPRSMEGLSVGMELYRNFDIDFVRQLEKPAQRKIALSMLLRETETGFVLEGRDEDGVMASVATTEPKQPAQKPDAARQTIDTQLRKLGNTLFECAEVQLDLSQMYFFPVSALNEMKRSLVQKQIDARLAAFESGRPTSSINCRSTVEYPEKHLSYLGNVLNDKAREFYRKHGVEIIEPAAEAGANLAGRLVMKTKYCIRRELNLCPGTAQSAVAEPLVLVDENGHQFRIEFLCGQCGMNLFADAGV